MYNVKPSSPSAILLRILALKSACAGLQIMSNQESYSQTKMCDG